MRRCLLEIRHVPIGVADFHVLTAAGVRFTQNPAEIGPVVTAVLDDTCGNLSQIASMAAG